MNRLVSSVKGLFGNTVGAGKTAGEKAVNVIKKIVATKIKFTIFAPVIVTVTLILILFLVIVSMFNEKLNLLQMVDPSGGKVSISGKGIYTDAEFEEAVSVGNTSSKGGSYSDFVSSLADSSFKNVDGFNEFIKSNVEKAGFGTREGVVAAAMALCYELPKETGSRYFYTSPGNLTHNGMSLHEGITESTYMDCREFVQWALYNGGFKATELGYIDGIKSMGTIKSNVRDAQPGDIFSTDGPGHIWLVVAVDENGYYAAEEYSGAEINYYTWDSALNGYSADLYDMSSYYDNPDNVRSP